MCKSCSCCTPMSCVFLPTARLIIPLYALGLRWCQSNEANREWWISCLASSSAAVKNVYRHEKIIITHKSRQMEGACGRGFSKQCCCQVGASKLPQSSEKALGFYEVSAKGSAKEICKREYHARALSSVKRGSAITRAWAEAHRICL